MTLPPGVNVIKLFPFVSYDETMRLNKLDRLSFETLSSQVLEFEGKARAETIGAPFRCFLMDKLLLFPSNVILDWKMIASYKHCSLFCLIDSDEGKSFYNIDTWKKF
jgi:hypothetical protein